MKQKCYLSLFIINLICVFASCNLTLLHGGHLKGFKCFGATLISTPIRLNSHGEVECFSLDGRDCSQGFTNDHECRTYVASNKRSVSPVVCTKEQYKKKDHWCREGKKFFYSKWHCPYETGLEVAVKFDEAKFKVSCLSQDGVTCFTGKEANDKCRKANNCGDFKKTIKAKACTKADNTELKENWCKGGFAYFRHSGHFSCRDKTGVDMAVGLSRQGHVKCLSKDGAECQSDLNTIEKCATAVLKANDGGFKRVKTVTCTAENFKDKTHWCSKGYTHIYHRDTKKPNPAVKKIRQAAKANFKPKWVAAFKRLIQSHKATTNKGIKRIKKILKKHQFKFTGKRWKHIKHMIRAGVGKSRKGLKGLFRKIKKHTPALRRAAPVLPKHLKRHLKTPNWLVSMKKILSRPIAKTEKGVKYIKHVLATKGFRVSAKKWAKIEKEIKKGGEVKNIIHSIKKHTPALRKNAERKKKEEKKSPKWFKQLKAAIKHPKARTSNGLKIIKNVLMKHGFGFTPKVWKKMKRDIKSGKVLHTPMSFRRMINTIRSNTPALGGKIKHKKGVFLKFGGGKKCGKRVWKHLRKLLREEDSKTPEGLKKIKHYLMKHFKVTDDIWNRILEAIQNGLLRTAHGRNGVMKHIKKHMPKHRHHHNKRNEELFSQ